MTSNEGLHSPWNGDLGVEHGEAVSYMQSTKREMEVIVNYGEEVHDTQATSSLESCFSDARRMVSTVCGEEVFDAIDTNKDGMLSGDEIANYIKRNPSLVQRVEKARAQQFDQNWVSLMDMLDTNGDHKLDEDEFVRFWKNSLLGNTEEGSMIFHKIDASGDGQVTAREIKAYLKEHSDTKDQLVAVRVNQLTNQWALFFSSVADDNESSFDRSQFAALWAASGLGSVSSSAPLRPQRSFVRESVQNVPLLTDRKQATSPYSSSLLPPIRPASAPNTARSPPLYPNREVYANDDLLYLARPGVELERPCLARKVDYSSLLAEQGSNLKEREKSMGEYKHMLTRMEEYQKKSLRLLEAHFGALDPKGRWRQLRVATRIAASHAQQECNAVPRDDGDLLFKPRPPAGRPSSARR